MMISAWWLLLVPVASCLAYIGGALLRKCAICGERAACYCPDCVAKTSALTLSRNGRAA